MKKAILLVIPALLGVGFGKVMAKFIPPHTSKAELVPVLVMLPLIILFVLAVHELGHLAGGKLVGFRFVMLAIGPVFVTRDRQWKLEWNRSLSLWGGVAAAIPIRRDNLTKSMRVYIVAGPAASLLLAAALWALSSRFEVRIAAAFSALIGVTTLIPMGVGGFLSDGARLIMLLRNGPAARRWSALAALGSYSFTMTRPRDWPQELIREARALPDASADDLSAAWLDFRASLDRGDTAHAADAIDYVWEHRQRLPKISADLVAIDRTTFYSLYRQQPSAAPRAIPLASPHSLELAEAAVLLAQGDRKTAAEKARLELQRMPVPDNGTALMIQDLLREVLRQATA